MLLWQVEAGLDDLRAAYAELHQQLDSGARPPEEKERLAQHVSIPLLPCCSRMSQTRKQTERSCPGSADSTLPLSLGTQRRPSSRALKQPSLSRFSTHI